jgi:hypothetical protein
MDGSSDGGGGRHGSNGRRLTHPTIIFCIMSRVCALQTWKGLYEVDPSYSNILYDE